ncbi:MAG TPA: hypothetical protein VE338_17765 [Ktedonobacterales bacterium]|nr:hypothetical protein [Ktedonobacterales bacterium]
MLAGVTWRRARTLARSVTLAGLLGCLGLAGCAMNGSTSGGASAGATSVTATATDTPADTPTPEPTTCAQVQGFAGAASLALPNIELPAGAVAPAPAVSFGGAGQYTIKTYSVCVPNNSSHLIVSTGKGPEPLTQLLPFYGWTAWTQDPDSGDAQQVCAGSCFAFNVDNLTKALFAGAPRFLSLEQVTPLANGLVTFKLALAQAPNPTCGSMFDAADMAMYGHAPEYALYYDFGGPGASIQMEWPPMTRLVGDSTPSTIGQDLCSAGTAASVKAFMDNQFASHGFTSVACAANGNDCWTSAGTTVTMNITSASDWMLSAPRPQGP